MTTRKPFTGKPTPPKSKSSGDTFASRASDSGPTQAPDAHRMPKIPSERDETAEPVNKVEPEPKLVAAKKGMDKGIVDTDRRSAYGLSDDVPIDRNAPKTKVRALPRGKKNV